MKEGKMAPKKYEEKLNMTQIFIEREKPLVFNSDHFPKNKTYMLHFNKACEQRKPDLLSVLNLHVSPERFLLPPDGTIRRDFDN